MRRLPGLLAALIVASGCAGVTVESSPTTGPDVPGTTAVEPNPSPTTTSVPSTTTTTEAVGPPVGIIAPSGVPVGVTGINGEVFEVLTPCGNPATLTDGEPIYEVDVMIDPGHGGPIDTGAVAPTGLHEEDINLQVGMAVHEILAERGIRSMLTRTGDYPVPIRVRSTYSDLMGAEALVSIHHNAPVAPASDIPGIEIFVRSDTPESARLGGLLYEETMSALGEFDVDWDRSPDAGVMTVHNTEGRDAYGMVRLPEAPSVLLELGYIVNRAEAELYGDPAYVPAAATAVADAIEAFLTTDDTGASLVEGRIFDAQRGVGRDQCVEPDLEASLYPEVVDVTVNGGPDGFNFIVTVSSPYDSAERYADAWRIVGDDGVVYGVSELLHDHATEQPFTRSLDGVVIPDTVRSVTIQARDLVYGWGGASAEVTLP